MRFRLSPHLADICTTSIDVLLEEFHIYLPVLADPEAFFFCAVEVLDLQ